MSVTSRYILVCDEVRVENNGKLIVIGLYTPNILVPQLPYVFPALTLLSALDVDQPGRYNIRAHFQHLGSGREFAQAIGLMEIAQPGLTISVLRFGNLQVDMVGAFSFSLNINGQPDPITTTFDIILQAAPPRRQ